MTPSRRAHLRKYSMRACAAGMAVLAVIVVVSGEASGWRLLLALLLLACPAIVIWSALRFGLSDDVQPGNEPERSDHRES